MDGKNNREMKDNRLKKAWKSYLGNCGLKKKLKGRLAALYPMENPDVLYYSFLEKWLKRLLVFLAAALVLAALAMVFGKEEPILQDGSILSRPGYNEAELEVKIKAEIGGREGTEKKEGQENITDITLRISPRKYTLEEFETIVKEAIPDLEKSILGTNLSAEEIKDNLVLPAKISNTPIEILWKSDKEEIINGTGAVNAEVVGEEGSVVNLTAVFLYEDYKMSHAIGLFVKPLQLTRQESLQRLLSSEIEKAFASSEEEEKIHLPQEIDGNPVFFEEEKQEKKGAILFFAVGGILLWAAALKEEIEAQEKRRRRELLMDYPELISQFTLLLGAGMTVTGVWKRLMEQYGKYQKEDGKKRRYVYEEMVLTWREMQNGVSEAEALSRFGNRIKLAPYLKFSTLLSQNLRKGSRGLTELLKTEGKLAYEERKEMAKQLGEEAGTKLLLPMMLMLGIVLVVILVPAFLSF